MPPVGVIEALWRGFDIVTRQFWLILPPVALDLFLWLGPQLSPGPILPRLIPQGLPAANAADLRQFGEQLNLFALLSTAPLGLPSLVRLRSQVTPAGSAVAAIELTSLRQFAVVIVVLPLLGLWLGSLYLGLIGQVVRDGRPDLRELLRRMWGYWLRAVLFVAIVLTLLAALMVPVLILAALVALFSQTLALLVWLIWVTLAVWVVIYLAFAVHGIILQGQGVLRAMWDSVRMVQWSLYPTLGLFAAILALSVGLGVVWSLPRPDSWLMLAGIGGNAFINTGLVAATFVYYQDRYRRWQAVRSIASSQ